MNIPPKQMSEDELYQALHEFILEKRERRLTLAEKQTAWDVYSETVRRAIPTISGRSFIGILRAIGKILGNEQKKVRN